MGLRGPKARGQEPWMVKVADLMIQEHMSFSAACQALSVKFDDAASERAAQYSEAFRDIVDALSFKFHARTGGNPLLTKEVILGWLTVAIQKLGEANQWDRVSIPAKLMADMQGWTKSEGNPPVIFNLSQKDIDELKTKLKEDAERDEIAEKSTGLPA